MTGATQTIHIVRTGTANIASVAAGMQRLGLTPVLTTSPEDVRTCPRLVLPGVGAMGATMAGVDSAKLASVLRERIHADRPTLAVCMGHQLLGSSSDESPGMAGLAVHDAHAERFPGDTHLRVPQLGWNLVTPAAGARFLTTPGHAYFANSYCFRSTPAGWQGAKADYAGPFIAALERGHVLTCQFHPELSGAWGLGVLSRWLSASGATPSMPSTAAPAPPPAAEASS